MSPAQVEIQLIAAITAAACALPGVFLILRRMAMMSDAISHTVLLGIVVGFFITKDLTSPYLVLGAALTGVLTVSLVELVHRTRLVREDAAVGLVFPALFSIAVLLISRYAGDVHLDTDAVLLGELAFAPFNRFAPFGSDIGPIALYLMGGILLINLFFISLFYKELKLATFDAGLAASLGFAPWLIHYGLMALVSITAVGAFDTVGSVLVVALMVAPPMSAYLLTDRLSRMIALSVAIGVVNAILGYWLAHLLDASIAGSMASMAGITFGVIYLLAPERGLVALARRRARQRWEFAMTMLAIHLFNHEGLPEASQENREEHLSQEVRWAPDFAARVVSRTVEQGWVQRQEGSLNLTELGRQRAKQAIAG
ncbi:MAG: metal ABC transporter permease [Anaerolineales bacterium]|nr:metal ABC transporter permease [Anaerolineales bacterium]